MISPASPVHSEAQGHCTVDGGTLLSTEVVQLIIDEDSLYPQWFNGFACRASAPANTPEKGTPSNCLAKHLANPTSLPEDFRTDCQKQNERHGRGMEAPRGSHQQSLK